MTPEARLAALGIALPPAPPPVANYVNAVRTGNLVYLAGKGPLAEGGKLPAGHVGVDLTVEEGYRLARSPISSTGGDCCSSRSAGCWWQPDSSPGSHSWA